MSNINGAPVKAYVRVRPVTGDENKNGIVKVEHRLLYLENPANGSTSEFVFDGLFDANADQDVIFNEVGIPLLDHVQQGYNASCFAYGVSGSGKTHSIFGQQTSSGWDLPGLIPKTVDQILSGSKSSGNKTVFLSVVELENEVARDLGKAAQEFITSGAAGDLSVVDIKDEEQSHVKGLTYIEVSNSSQASAVLGALASLVKPTELGQASSRHTVFTISVVQQKDGAQPTTSRLNFVVLPPCGKSSQSSGVNAAVGKVLQNLSAQSPKTPVPYTEAKLTLLLKASLQPTSRIVVLANLHPTIDSHDECLRSLQYTMQCQGSSTASQVKEPSYQGRSSPQFDDEDLKAIEKRLAQKSQELDYTASSYSLPRSAKGGNRDSRTSEGAMASISALHGTGGHGGGAADAKVRRLEQQLEIYKDRLATAEGKIQEIKCESEEFRDRMTGRDHHQFAEIKALRSDVSSKSSEVEDVRAECGHQQEELKRRQEAEVVRLTKDAELLRNQLAAMGGSISNMMSSRSEKTAAEKRVKDAMQKDFESQVRDKVNIVTAEKDRQIENLKRQSQCFLDRKAEEVAGVRSEIARVQRESAAEVVAMQAESEYIASYAEKVTEIIRRMESGFYGVVDMGGVRSFKVLRQRVEAVDRLVEATRQASPSKPGTPRTSTLGLSSMVAGGALRNVATPPDSTWPPAQGSTGTLPSLQDLGQLRSQVVADLKSDKTVEYIRTLEAQVARYRNDVQSEKKRNGEMTVALRSLQRVASRPDSPLNAALSSGPNVKAPAQWGWGHSTMASGGGGDGSRPATAF
eukprot:gene25375-11036_t